jgi:hypothetical protein
VAVRAGIEQNSLVEQYCISLVCCGRYGSRRNIGHPLMSSEPPSTIITLLSSTSLLLERYGYSERDPSLKEIQSILGRAIVQLEAAATGFDEHRIVLDGCRRVRAATLE